MEGRVEVTKVYIGEKMDAGELETLHNTLEEVREDLLVLYDALLEGESGVAWAKGHIHYLRDKILIALANEKPVNATKLSHKVKRPRPSFAPGKPVEISPEQWQECKELTEQATKAITEATRKLEKRCCSSCSSKL